MTSCHWGEMHQPAKTVSQLVRQAALNALGDVIQAAHEAGDIATRNRLTDRWHAALSAGVGTSRGIASLSHT
jgi:hypothetical protein